MLIHKILACCAYSFIFYFPLYSVAEPIQKVNTSRQVSGYGVLKVVIRETEGAYIPNAKFEIVGKQFYKRYRTGERGELTIDLPEGWYTLSVNQGPFFPVARPVFKITSDKNINFEFTLLPQVLVEPNEGEKLDPSTIVEYLTEKIKLHTFPKREFGLIQYGEKVVNRKFQAKIQYLGFTHRFLHNPSERERYFPAVLMSNLFTISAKKITLDRKSGVAVAEESVTLHDGQAARTLKSLVIDLKQGKILKEEK